MSDVTPTLAQVFAAASGGEREDLRTWLPAKIVAYDDERQEASIQILVQDTDVDENGDRQVVTIPIIQGVPIAFPGGGSFSITWPVAVGDTGIALFAGSSIDKWLDRGGIVDPLDERHHSLSDAIFVPGLRDFRHPVPAAGVHSTAMVIRVPDELHAGGSEALALKADVDELRSKLLSHTHTGVTTGAGTSGVTATSVASMTGTTKLKGS